LLTSLEARERLCSTALAGGVALLHPRNHEPYMFDDSFIVVGRTVQAVPFGSPDGATTDLFFLVCCQDDQIHLHVLARICMMAHHTSVLLEMREAPDAGAIYHALVASEEEVIRTL
jgi:nitrogen PTS system EIIA component